MDEIKKIIRIERQAFDKSGTGFVDHWKPIPNGERVPLWETSTAESIDPVSGEASSRYLFHIQHMPLVARGNRVMYLGKQFRVLEVSDSKKLLGLELLCEPT